MTREEAIHILKQYNLYSPTRQIEEAMSMAIEALSAEPNCKDCKKHNNTTFFMDDEETIDTAIEALSADAVPHRRLIDADALIFELEEWKKNPNNDDSAVDLVNHFIGIIRATPSAEQVTGKLKNPCDSLLTDDSAECKEQKSKLDLISRADAIEAVCGDCSIETKNNCKEEGYCYEVRNLKALPSADRPQGEWTRKEDLQTYWYECSVCGEKPPRNQFGHENHSNYCPSCGAHMGEKE